jgi:hypothetical protein
VAVGIGVGFRVLVAARGATAVGSGVLVAVWGTTSVGLGVFVGIGDATVVGPAATATEVDVVVETGVGVGVWLGDRVLSRIQGQARRKSRMARTANLPAQPKRQRRLRGPVILLIGHTVSRCAEGACSD